MNDRDFLRALHREMDSHHWTDHVIRAFERATEGRDESTIAKAAKIRDAHIERCKGRSSPALADEAARKVIG